MTWRRVLAFGALAFLVLLTPPVARAAQTINVAFGTRYAGGFAVRGAPPSDVAVSITGDFDSESNGIRLSPKDGKGAITVRFPSGASHLRIDVVDSSFILGAGGRVNVWAEKGGTRQSLASETIKGSGPHKVSLLYREGTRTTVEIAAEGFAEFTVSEIECVCGFAFQVPNVDIAYLVALPINSKERALEFIRLLGQVGPEVIAYYLHRPSGTKPDAVRMFDKYQEVLIEKGKRARELLIDEETKRLPEGWKEVVRWYLKTTRVRLPERVTIYVAVGAITIATGGAATPLALAVTAGKLVMPDIAKEAAHALNVDYRAISDKEERAAVALIDIIQMAQNVQKANGLWESYNAGKLPWGTFVKEISAVAARLGLEVASTVNSQGRDQMILKADDADYVFMRKEREGLEPVHQLEGERHDLSMRVKGQCVVTLREESRCQSGAGTKPLSIRQAFRPIGEDRLTVELALISAEQQPYEMGYQIDRWGNRLNERVTVEGSALPKQPAAVGESWKWVYESQGTRTVCQSTFARIEPCHGRDCAVVETRCETPRNGGAVVTTMTEHLDLRTGLCLYSKTTTVYPHANATNSCDVVSDLVALECGE